MATLVSDLDVPQVPLFGDEPRVERQRIMREVARDSWLARTEAGYAVLHYDAVTGILRDKRWHSATGLVAEMAGIRDERYLARRRVTILNAEGDVHVRLRRLVAPAFSPRSADRLRPFMRDIVASLIEPHLATGRIEAVADLCEPYPIPVICELLGAPKEDWQLFSRLATDVLRIFGGNLAEEIDIIVSAGIELEEYTKGLIADRRTHPADDLITDLIAAEEDGDRLSTDELTMMVEAVIVGGTDTTRNQLGLALELFSRHPEQWQMLRDDPSMAPRAVEETMRYHGAVAGTIRFASEDIEFNGVLFPKGTFMSTSMSTANFDESVFADPLQFDIAREPAGQPQLSFGSGIHYCLGASLARAELQEALVVLSQSMPNLAPGGDVRHKPSAVGIFGPAHLPLTFDRRA
ncbi:MAG: cytochrome P450 [Ilumatobacteraceae bacterium]